MSTGPLPAPVPEIHADTAAFWEATGRHELLVQQCSDCGLSIWYPRFVCPDCHSTGLVYRTSVGEGTIYSFTLTTRGILEYKECGPYVLALVELDEGPKVLTNIVEAEPAELAIGQRVKVVFHDTGEGSALPRFRPLPA